VIGSFEAREHYRRGESLLRLDRPEEAIRSLAHALEHEPESVYTLCAMSQAYAMRKDWLSALSFAQRAVAADPDEEWAHRRISCCLDAMDRPAEALRAAEEAVRLEPDNPDALQQLCHMQRVTGRLGDAEATALELRAQYPDSASPHFELGLVRIRQRRFAEALQCNRDALAIDPEMSEALNNLGLALSELGETAAALDLYRQALQVEPEDMTAAANLLSQATVCGYASVDEFLLARGDRDFAWKIERRNALKKQASDLLEGYARITLGASNVTISSNIGTRRAVEAIQLLLQAADLTPYDPSIYTALAETFVKCGDPKEALRAVDYAIQVRPDYRRALELRSWILWTMSERAEWAPWRAQLEADAVAAAVHAVHMTKDNPNTIYYLCRLHLLASSRDPSHVLLAEQAAHRLVQLAPEDWFSYYVVGNVLEWQNRLHEAELCYKRGAECDPQCAAAAYAVGCILDRRFKRLEARRWFRHAVKLEPGNMSYRTAASRPIGLLSSI